VKVDVVIATWIVVGTCGIGGTPGVMVDLVEVGVTAISGEDLEVTEVPHDIIRYLIRTSTFKFRKKLHHR